MIAFFEVISTSAPHIYCSALPLSPQASIVQKLYKQYSHPLVRVVQGLPISWEPIVATLNIVDIRGSPVWSPCGRFIIILNDNANIFDAVTLKQLSTLKIADPSSCCFTPDSHFVVQFYGNKLISWDIQTGCPIGTAVLGSNLALHVLTSFTYSIDGKFLAVKCYSHAPCIITCNLLSMTHAGPYYPPGEIMDPIWTHGECLQFATRKLGYITIWEMEFTLMHPPVEAGSLQVPEINDKIHFLFLPTHSRIAFSLGDAVFIWDAQAAKFLLKSGPMFTPDFTYDYDKSYIQAKSFSPTGHFFAYIAIDNCVRVYKEFPTGYMLHQQFTVDHIPARYKLCFSPNGESIIVHHRTKVDLWHTRDHITSISNASTQGNSRDFCLLEFSPNGVLAAIAKYLGNTVSVLNLQSSDPPLTINVDMEVKRLVVMDSIILIASSREVATWNIIEGNCNLSTGGNITNGICISFSQDLSTNVPPLISHDLSHIFIQIDSGMNSCLWILDGSTGKHIGGISATNKLEYVQFTPDGCEIQGEELFPRHKMVGWKIIKDGKSGSVKLESLGEIKFTPKLPSWQSSLGYEVMNDGWVLSPNKERLLWLPHQWRSTDRYGGEKDRRWNGQILGLKHPGLSEVVILEFSK